MIQDVQKKVIASLMAIVLFGFSGQYVSNLALADDSWSDIQKNAAISQMRAMQTYEHTHVLPINQHTNYSGLSSTLTDETVYSPRASNISFGQIYSAAKGISIFSQIHALGLDKFSTGYSTLTNTPTDETVKMDRNTKIALAQAEMDKNNIKIIEAKANIQPHYVGIENTQTTDESGRDRNVLIQEAIAKLELENKDLAAQLASLYNYHGVEGIVSTDENGGDRQAYIEKAQAESETRAAALLMEMNVSNGPHYIGIDNTQTTDTNGRDRNVLLQDGYNTMNQKLQGCYDADHPRTCDITSGAKYAQYMP
jgi:hypothetical protein